MAHFTGLKQLQNHPHRSGFDIGAKNVFSAKCGELLPVYWDLAIPGCTYDINIQYFTRTRPVQTAAYTRIREYFDFYAVPIDLLWKSFDASVIQMGDVAPVQSKDLLNALTVKGDLPWCTLNDLNTGLYYANGNKALGNSVSVSLDFANIMGFNRGDTGHKLLHMLDYGNIVDSNNTSIGTTSNRWWNRQKPITAVPAPVQYSQKYRTNLAVNVLPLAAYQKIYQDFFRWSQWENTDPTSYNFDWYNGEGNIFGADGLQSSIPASNAYWKRDNLFTLRYCNWNKDLFMGILPNSQFGDIAVVDIEGGINIPVKRVPVSSDKATSSSIKVGAQFSEPNNCTITNSSRNLSTGDTLSVSIPSSSYNLESSFSILALRQAEALQKYREITQSVDTNYRDQIKAHFGINVPASDSHMAQYIGGVARNLDISEVVNNNLQGDGEAVIYGKGVGTGNGSMRFSTGSRYCIVMCIYHCVPLLDYSLSGPDGQLLCTSIEDLPIPEFDNIGMEGVPVVQLFNSAVWMNKPIDVNSILGYNPRYYNWKTKIDRVHGAFTTSLLDWVAPVDDDYLFKYITIEDGTSTKFNVSFPFFKVNPNTLDNIFAVKADSTWETDQFLVNAYIGCKVVRPLSRDGVPY